MEKCLSLNVTQHKEEKQQIIELANESLTQVKCYADKLREEIIKKGKEMQYVKVKTIL